VNAVREREKSLHVAIGFTLALHGHMSLIPASRSRRAHADKEYIQKKIVCLIFHVRASRSRFTFPYRWNTGLMHIDNRDPSAISSEIDGNGWVVTIENDENM